MTGPAGGEEVKTTLLGFLQLRSVDGLCITVQATSAMECNMARQGDGETMAISGDLPGQITASRLSHWIQLKADQAF
jgi:hypothetical protein